MLLHDVGGEEDAREPALRSAVEVSGRYAIPGVGGDGSRLVAPGAPERSALLHRMASRRASSQMPPLGTVMVDEEAVALVRRWIEDLEGSGTGADPATRVASMTPGPSAAPAH